MPQQKHQQRQQQHTQHAALAQCFQPSTLHKLRQPGFYTNTDTPDGNDIINNNHAALTESFQPSTLDKVRQLGRYTNTDTPELRTSLMPRWFLLKSPTPGPTRSRAVQEGENRTVSLTSSRRAWQVYVIIHRDGGQRSDHFQSRTTGADRTAHDGGRARSGGSDNEG